MQSKLPEFNTRRNDDGNVMLGLIILIAFCILMFAWYANTIIPHTYPTVYTNWFWGLLHGFMAVPTFFWSLFADTVTIYQAPNSGGWYNFGYMLGIGAFGVGASNT